MEGTRVMDSEQPNTNIGTALVNVGTLGLGFAASCALEASIEVDASGVMPVMRAEAADRPRIRAHHAGGQLRPLSLLCCGGCWAKGHPS